MSDWSTDVAVGDSFTAGAREHLLPWTADRLRRRPAGMGRAAERLHLAPLAPPSGGVT